MLLLKHKGLGALIKKESPFLLFLFIILSLPGDCLAYLVSGILRYQKLNQPLERWQSGLLRLTWNQMNCKGSVSSNLTLSFLFLPEVISFKQLVSVPYWLAKLPKRGYNPSFPSFFLVHYELNRIRTYIRNLEGFCPDPLDDEPYFLVLF